MYFALPLCPPSLNLTLVKDCDPPQAGLGIWVGVFKKADVGRERIQGPTSPFSSPHLNLSQRSFGLQTIGLGEGGRESVRQVQRGGWCPLGSEANIAGSFIGAGDPLGIPCQPKSSLLLTLRLDPIPAPELLSDPPAAILAISGSPCHPTMGWYHRPLWLHPWEDPAMPTLPSESARATPATTHRQLPSALSGAGGKRGEAAGS